MSIGSGTVSVASASGKRTGGSTGGSGAGSSSGLRGRCGENRSGEEPSAGDARGGATRERPLYRLMLSTAPARSAPRPYCAASGRTASHVSRRGTRCAGLLRSTPYAPVGTPPADTPPYSSAYPWYRALALGVFRAYGSAVEP